jgi:hypothetical protein
MSDRLILTSQEDGKTIEVYESPDNNLEIYVDGVHGMMLSGATVKINCFTRDFSRDENVDRRSVACRLVMNVETFFDVVHYMNLREQDLKANPEAKHLINLAK